jgi:hypothetical protein
MAVAGGCIAACSISSCCIVIAMTLEDTNAMTKPINKRLKNVTKPQIMSFFPGLMSQWSKFFVLSSRYQIRAREGILYKNNLLSSIRLEKPSWASFIKEPVEADKNRTT